MATGSEEAVPTFSAKIGDDGQLRLTHDLGVANAGRNVRVSLELMPEEPEHRGSRQHVLNLLDDAFAELMEEILGREDVVLQDACCPVPAGRRNTAETDLDTYIAKHCKEIWPQAGKELDTGRWWAPCGGTCPQMDLICRIKLCGRDGFPLSFAPTTVVISCSSGISMKGKSCSLSVFRLNRFQGRDETPARRSVYGM